MGTESVENRLKVGDEWQEVKPRQSGYTLLTDGENLIANSTSFDHIATIGYISGVNCPIAVDHTNKIAYRSVHQKINDKPRDTDDYLGNIAVEIRSFDLRSRKSTLLTKLPNGLDCYWLLELLPNQRKLLALFSEHRQQPQSYLGTIDLENGSITQTPIPDKAFYPSALSLEHEQIIFSGSHGGAVLINFDGDTVGALEPGTLYNLEGADFVGGSRDIVLGGNGVHIWDPVTGAFDTVVDSGSYPVSNGAGQIWFNSSDGAVSYYDLQGKTVSSVASLSGVEMTDTGYAQPVMISVDRRMVLARLAGTRELNSVEYAEKESIYDKNSMAQTERDEYCHIHYSCVVDTKERTLWKYPDYAHNVAWVAGEYYDVNHTQCAASRLGRGKHRRAPGVNR